MLPLGDRFRQKELGVRSQNHIGAAASVPAAAEQAAQQRPAQAGELTQECNGVAAGMHHALACVSRLQDLSARLQSIEVDPVAADESFEVFVGGNEDFMAASPQAHAKSDVGFHIATRTRGRDCYANGPSLVQAVLVTDGR